MYVIWNGETSMNDYIKIPSHIDDVYSLYSNNLKKLEFSKYLINESHVYSLDLLRDLYKADRELFFIIRDEMLLRGFEIRTEKVSSLFPATEYSGDIRLLYKEYNSNKFLNINFDNLKLGNLINRFNIDNDKFFNLIPLENFKFLNQSINLDLLRREFSINGFSYIKKGEELDLQKKDTHTIINDSIQSLEESDLVSIDEYFSEGIYNIFIDFCWKNNVYHVHEITDELLNKFKGVKGVGTRKFNAVKQKYDSFEKLDEERSIKREPSVKLVFNIESNLHNKLMVASVFSEYKFNMFREYCERNNIKYLEDLEESHIESFRNIKGIGPKNYKELKNKISSLKKKTDFSKYLEESAPKEEFIFRLDSMLFNKYLIDTVFEENKFNSFREFCKENNIEYIEELTHIHLNLFKTSRGVGKTKFNNVLKRIDVIKERLEKENNFTFSYNLENFDLHDFSVNEILKSINMESELQQDLSIEDIFDQDIRKLNITDEDKKILSELLFKIHYIDNPNKILQNFFSNLDERDYSIIIDRYKNKHTLETIGKKLNLTRERVRQLAKRIIDKFILFLKQQLFKESIIFSFLGFDYSELKVLTVSDFSHFIERDYLFILEIFVEEDTFFYYEDRYNLFFLDKFEKKNFEFEIKEINEQLPEVFVVEDVQELFQTHYFRSGTLTIEGYLKTNSYKKFGTIYSSGVLAIEDIMKFLFERDLPKQVKMTEENYKKIVIIAKEKYGFELNNPLVSVTNSLLSSDNFLLVDGSTYQLLDIEEYDLNVLENCMRYGEKILNKRNHVNSAEIFDEFRDDLEYENIKNKTQLYSLLKHLYNNQFQFGKGNTLNIYNLDSNKLNEDDLLVEFLNTNGGIKSRNEIKNKFNWSDQKITLKISTTDKVISWGRNNFRALGDWVTETYLEETNKIIATFFDEQGFITENQLFEEAQFSLTLYKLIDEEKVDSPEKFRSIFRPFINELKGISVFITPEVSNYESIYDVILDKFHLGVSRDELYDYLRNDLLYREGTANQIIDKVITNNLMFEVELGYLYPTEKLDISEAVVEELLNYIEKEKKDKPFIILKNLIGYRAKLPKINVEWTPYLMKQLLLNNGYKSIEAFNMDYRTDQLILIEEYHEINRLDELLYTVLKKNYEGNWHEEYVADYLEREGFLYEKTYGRKKLPISLYKNSNLIDVDELGVVNLVGD